MVFRVPLLGKAEDFTIYIKNFIHFPKFNFSKYVGLGSWGCRGGALPGPPGGWAPVYVTRMCVCVNERGAAGRPSPCCAGRALPLNAVGRYCGWGRC